MNKLPLEGLKVADFTWVIAGPHTSHYLCDFGATTIHIESTIRPDLARYTGPMKNGIAGLDNAGRPAYHNRGKLSITLNLPKPRGREIALRLIKWADVVVENMAPGAMGRLGLGYEDAIKVNPDIIYLSISNAGQTGPEAHHAGWGTVVVASAGVTHLTGYSDGAPVPVLSSYVDYTVPPLAATAILAALDYRDRTGKGQQIDVSQLETGLFFLQPALLDYTVNGRIQKRDGNRDPMAAPHGCYRCKQELDRKEERWCVIAVFTEEEWQSFCRVIGSPEWTRDSKFSTFLNRKKNEDELDRLVEEWTINRTPAEVMYQMQAAGVAAGMVEDARDNFEDPQLRYRQHWAEVGNPVLGKMYVDGIPAHLSKTPGIVGNPPILGEHNKYVCKNILGMSDGEISKLEAEEILK